MQVIKSFPILILVFLANFCFAQTLKLSDLRKSYNYHKPNEHKQFFSKGFRLVKDSISERHKIFWYQKTDTKEKIELTFSEDGEGGEYLYINYFLPSEIAYKKIISTLPANQFKYSKRNQRYQLPTSSYSGENVYAKGLVKKDGQQLYLIEYHSYIDKALSGPRPENGRIPSPPIQDSLKNDF